MKPFNFNDFKNYTKNHELGKTPTINKMYKCICEYVGKDIDYLKNLRVDEVEDIIVSNYKINSLAHTRNIKKALKVVLDWFCYCEALTEYETNILGFVNAKHFDKIAMEKFYFKDLDSLIEWIDKEVAVKFNVDTKDLLMYKTLFCLFYSSASITMYDVVNIKKSDCDDEEFTITIGNEEIEIGEKYYNSIIKPYKKLTFLFSFGVNVQSRRTILKETEYLFRGKAEQMKEDTVWYALHHFNDCLKAYGFNKTITLVNFRKVRYFNEIKKALVTGKTSSAHRYCFELGLKNDYIGEISNRYGLWEETYIKNK